jgi:hypothetical protein
MVMKTDNLIGNDGISPFQTLDNLWNQQGSSYYRPFFPYHLYMVKLGLRLRALPKVKTG